MRRSSAKQRASMGTVKRSLAHSFPEGGDAENQGPNAPAETGGKPAKRVPLSRRASASAPGGEPRAPLSRRTSQPSRSRPIAEVRQNEEYLTTCLAELKDKTAKELKKQRQAAATAQAELQRAQEESAAAREQAAALERQLEEAAGEQEAVVRQRDALRAVAEAHGINAVSNSAVAPAPAPATAVEVNAQLVAAVQRVRVQKRAAQSLLQRVTRATERLQQAASGDPTPEPRHSTEALRRKHSELRTALQSHPALLDAKALVASASSSAATCSCSSSASSSPTASSPAASPVLLAGLPPRAFDAAALLGARSKLSSVSVTDSSAPAGISLDDLLAKRREIVGPSPVAAAAAASPDAGSPDATGSPEAADGNALVSSLSKAMRARRISIQDTPGKPDESTAEEWQ